MKAAAKDENLVVWDENGQVIGLLTDNVPEGALRTNPDGSVPAFDDDGNPKGTVDAETVQQDDEQKGTQEDAERQNNGSNDGEGAKYTIRTE